MQKEDDCRENTSFEVFHAYLDFSHIYLKNSLNHFSRC